MPLNSPLLKEGMRVATMRQGGVNESSIQEGRLCHHLPMPFARARSFLNSLAAGELSLRNAWGVVVLCSILYRAIDQAVHRYGAEPTSSAFVLGSFAAQCVLGFLLWKAANKHEGTKVPRARLYSWGTKAIVGLWLLVWIGALFQ